jgi:hypothetical protein
VKESIEYMILIPMMILLIFLFPLLVNTTMNTWANDRKSLALQETASHLSSSIQQIYQSLNHTSVLTCDITSNLNSQPFIEGYVYTGNATLRTIGSSNSLNVTLYLLGTTISSSISVTLGQNVAWRSSSFTSNSASACIKADKFQNQTIQLAFG